VIRALSEVAAKAELRAAGIAVPDGCVYTDAQQAVTAAEQLGYPVVLKIVSSELAHKSDIGGVAVGIGTAEAVQQAFDDIWQRVREQRPDARLDGVLVERMAPGQELLVGASRSEFGPLLLFGRGGIEVEVLRDVSYRLAPITHQQARAMMQEIRGYPLLKGFRGQPAVDLDRVAEVLVRVSELLVNDPRIAELDINPLMAGPADVVAADAHIVLADPPADGDVERPLDPQAIDSLFAPRSVAVVGATVGRYNRGRAWLSRVERAGYQGQLFAVSRREQVDHWPTYPSIGALPCTPDLVLVEVGRDNVPAVLQECVDRGVPWISIHTAGYAETGSSEGADEFRALQSRVAGSASHIVGPNALGPYCPRSGILPGDVTTLSGHLGVLSQSGATLMAIGNVVGEKHIGVSKGLSYGTESDVTVDEFLTYLADDAETELVTVYLEGTRRPRQFLAALERLAARKPVVVLKGGLTDAGARAAASHSGSLASSAHVWQALFTRTGAVQAATFEELIDLIVAFSFAQRVRDRRLAIVTPSGAAAVAFADAAWRHDFVVAELAAGTRQRLQTVLPAGTSAQNPVDVAQGYFRHESMAGVFDSLSGDDEVSFVLYHLAMDVFATTVSYAPWVQDTFVKTLVEAGQQQKPVVVVMPHTVADGKRAELADVLLAQGIPVFATADTALAALSKLLAYRSRSLD
jgi:acyl-CoA synthetase (NDP forming)